MNYRAGYVGIVGWPNSGKSTFLNSIIKEKISIVSDKPQTTRRRVIGIDNREESQIVYLDAPGFVYRQDELNKYLSYEADSVIQDSDILVVMLSIDTEKKEELETIINKAVESRKPWVAVIAKTDLLQFSSRIQKIKDILSELKNPPAVVEYSNRDKEKHLADLYSKVLHFLPASKKPFYDEDLYTPHSVREISAEMIREKCFQNLKMEVPYGVAVEIQKFTEEPGINKISAIIVSGRESHKSIIIGKGGEMIKKIGTDARKEIEDFTGKKCFLELHVKIDENWMNSKRKLKEFGYETKIDSSGGTKIDSSGGPKSEIENK